MSIRSSEIVNSSFLKSVSRCPLRVQTLIEQEVRKRGKRTSQRNVNINRGKVIRFRVGKEFWIVSSALLAESILSGEPLEFGFMKMYVNVALLENDMKYIVLTEDEFPGDEVGIALRLYSKIASRKPAAEYFRATDKAVSIARINSNHHLMIARYLFDLSKN